MQKKEKMDKAFVTASSQNSSQSAHQQELVIYLIINFLLDLPTHQENVSKVCVSSDF